MFLKQVYRIIINLSQQLRKKNLQRLLPSVKDYRPVSVLPNVSNFFGRIMLEQILEQMNKYL